MKLHLKKFKNKMEQGIDKLDICKCCNSNACYTSVFTTKEGKADTWLCMTCGFTSNSMMKEDDERTKEMEKYTAELIKDLKQVHDGLVFYPTVITMPDKGMIFPEPIKESKEKDWGWTVVKAIPIPKKDQEKFPDPRNPGEFYKNKMDMKNPSYFDKLCFMDAAEDLGMFDPNLIEDED